MKTASMTHHDPSDSVMAFLSGMVAHIIGVITFDGIVLPLLMAFGAGFVGMLGKKAAESGWRIIVANIKAKLKTRPNRRLKK